jgi:glutathione S-transferase
MGQVPMLEVGDSTKIVQSKAIERYLARKFSMYGATEEQGALIDALGELLSDLKTKWSAAKEEEAKAAFFEKELPKQLAFVEALYPSLFDALSLADVQFYHFFTHYFSAPEAKAAAAKALAACPETKQRVEFIALNTDIAKHEAGRAARGETF